MAKKQKKEPKSFAQQLAETFGFTKDKADAGTKKDERPSIAERINFGGNAEKLKKKRLKGK